MLVQIVLRPPAAADQVEFLARTRASRALHGPWVKAATTSGHYAAEPYTLGDGIEWC